MNARELQTKRAFREWTEALPLIREKLNKLRKKSNKNPFGDTGAFDHLVLWNNLLWPGLLLISLIGLGHFLQLGSVVGLQILQRHNLCLGHDALWVTSVEGHPPTGEFFEGSDLFSIKSYVRL